MKQDPLLKEAIAKSRGTSAVGDVNLSLFMSHIAKEVLAGHLAGLEKEFKDYIDAMRERLSRESRVILEEAIRTHWEQLRGPQGAPGDDGDDADVDLEKVAKMAAGLVEVKTPEVDYETIKQQIITLIPEQELDEETGEPIDPADIAPEKVVEKVNASKVPIKIESIAGLSQYLKSLDRNIREALRKGGGGASGGGMGNPQHEQFSVTSSTTDVTLKYKIAANGFAIWAYYNNGYLVRTTDYTVGANRKTLTLTFTPQDPIPGQTNAINVVYIRA